MIKETMIITGTSETRNEEEEENTIAHLSYDIIFSQILTRLPSKTLFRFSCVSQLWYNTIHHDPFFIANHLNHSKSNPSLVVIYGRGYYGTSFVYLDQEEQEEGNYGTRFMYLDQEEQEEETASSSSSSDSSSFLMVNPDIDAKIVVGSINGPPPPPPPPPPLSSSSFLMVNPDIDAKIVVGSINPPPPPPPPPPRPSPSPSRSSFLRVNPIYSSYLMVNPDIYAKIVVGSINGPHPPSSSSSSFLMENPDIDAKIVVGSINGLTCICTNHFIEICNPGTHEILSIPYPKEHEFLHLRIYGFGFDPLMNVYKVLRIECNDFSYLGMGDDLSCKIFSLGAGAQDCIWRDVNVTNDVRLKECRDQERYCEYPFNYSNGALFKVIPLSNIIIKFDVHYEKFQVIPGLQVSRDRFHLDSMCDFRGCPYAVYRQDLGDGSEYSLYALKKQKSSSNSSNVGSSTHFVFEHAVLIPFKPKTISISFIEWSGKMLLQWIEDTATEDTATELYVYNQHDERLQELERRLLQGSPLLVVKHIDSLLSLKTLVPPSYPFSNE